jgi:hypothetical protein
MPSEGGSNKVQTERQMQGLRSLVPIPRIELLVTSITLEVYSLVHCYPVSSVLLAHSHAVYYSEPGPARVNAYSRHAQLRHRRTGAILCWNAVRTESATGLLGKLA